MGMYDDIKVNEEVRCNHCNHVLTGFQSKDGDCVLETLEYWQVDNFYTSCENCGFWTEFTLPAERRRKIPLSAYGKTCKSI